MIMGFEPQPSGKLRSGVWIPEDGAEACLSMVLGRCGENVDISIKPVRRGPCEFYRDFASEGEARIGGQKVRRLGSQAFGFPVSSAALPAGVRKPRLEGTIAHLS